jgi:hypothetical protein
MNSYRFAELPSNASVSAFVTFAVSAWFLVAGAAIVTDEGVSVPAAAAEPIPVVYAAPAVAIEPEARLIIVVEGRRA